MFLIDEDTSATNFMVRDDLMQKIISRSQEPITPFIERARDLYEKAGISTIMVAGSSGAYFYIADTIIQMDCYVPKDITASTKAFCESYGAEPIGRAPNFTLPAAGRKLSSGRTGRTAAQSAGGRGFEARGQSLDGKSFGGRGGAGRDAEGGRSADAGRGGHRDDRIKTKTFGKDSLQVGKETVDLRFVEQLIDSEQTNALSQMLRFCVEKQYFERYSLTEAVSRSPVMANCVRSSRIVK